MLLSILLIAPKAARSCIHLSVRRSSSAGDNVAAKFIEKLFHVLIFIIPQDLFQVLRRNNSHHHHPPRRVFGCIILLATLKNFRLFTANACTGRLMGDGGIRKQASSWNGPSVATTNHFLGRRCGWCGGSALCWWECTLAFAMDSMPSFFVGGGYYNISVFGCIESWTRSHPDTIVSRGLVWLAFLVKASETNTIMFMADHPGESDGLCLQT